MTHMVRALTYCWSPVVPARIEFRRPIACVRIELLIPGVFVNVKLLSNVLVARLDTRKKATDESEESA